MSDAAFIEAIREQPADDTVRLIYADWLMDRNDPDQVARGEFIRIQVDRGPHRPSVWIASQRLREQELATAHLDRWLAPLRDTLGPDTPPWMIKPNPAHACTRFVRGFIRDFHFSAKTYLAHAETLRRLTPVPSLIVSTLEDAYEDFLLSPLLDEIESLNLHDYYRRPLDPEGMRLLAGSPHLNRLTELKAWNSHLGDAGTVRLASAPWFAQLTHLNLGAAGLGPEGITALAQAHTPNLRYLNLANGDPDVACLAALARSSWLGGLESLFVYACKLTDAHLDALLAGNLGNLRELDLRSNSITRPESAIRAHLPRIETLWV
jgi:uncharacterized protein (TIGR02996 family)